MGHEATEGGGGHSVDVDMSAWRGATTWRLPCCRTRLLPCDDTSYPVLCLVDEVAGLDPPYDRVFVVDEQARCCGVGCKVSHVEEARR